MSAEQEVIANLKFISMIKKNEKINTKFMYVQKDGILTRLSRTFLNPDNRYNTLTFVERTINNAFKILEKYSNSNKRIDKKCMENLTKDLLNSRIGLSNIQQTYESDLKFNCDITTLIELIENRLSNEIDEVKGDVFDDEVKEVFDDEVKEVFDDENKDVIDENKDVFDENEVEIYNDES